MRYHAIGYLILLAMLSGCANMRGLPVCPEITISMCPAISIAEIEP